MRWRSDWWWILGILAVLSLGFWWRPGAGQRIDDSYSASPGGKKAFYRIVDSMGWELERNTELFAPRLDDYSTICILGPARYPTRSEWEALYEWVIRGGRLVFAARHDSPEVDLGSIGMKIREHGSVAATADDDFVEGRTYFPVLGESEAGFHTVFSDGEYDWTSRGSVHGFTGRTEVFAAVGKRAQIVRRRLGRGVIVVVASDRVFTNESVADLRRDHGRLAYRIFETCGPAEPVAFDEVLNSSGTPKVFAILFDPTFRRVTLQLLLCVVLFGWWGVRRFGPPTRSREVTHRSIVEHAEALGNLHFKARTGTQLVEAYVEYFRRELALRTPMATSSAGLDDLTSRESIERLARWLDLEPRVVGTVLGKARAALRSENIGNGEAGAIIRALAKLRRRLKARKGARDGA